MTGKDLRAIRERLGMTQGDLAERLGVQLNTISRWELGQRKISKPIEKLILTLKR